MLKLNRRWYRPVALLLLFGGRAATAQETTGAAPTVGIGTLPHRYARDEWHIWTSPFRSSAQRTHTLKKYGLPFAVLSAVLIATDRKTGKILPNTTDQAIWSGRVSQLGASYTIAGFSGATYLLGKAMGNEHASEAGLLGLEAFGHAQLAVFAIKQMTNRQRPVDGEGKGSFWKGGTSFPSGHAAGAFAVATVFAYEYRDHLIVPITAYSLAAVVSASRIGARRHWLSDITVGGSLGFLIGRFTYKRNHNPNLPGSPVRRAAVTMIPDVGIGADGGVRMSWRLTPSR
jgi:membrane-associated phospholipid phosphatase